MFIAKTECEQKEGTGPYKAAGAQTRGRARSEEHEAQRTGEPGDVREHHRDEPDGPCLSDSIIGTGRDIAVGTFYLGDARAACTGRAGRAAGRYLARDRYRGGVRTAE